MADGASWQFDLWDLPWLAVAAALALAYLTVGAGVKRGAAWARTPAIVMLILALLTFPIGTIISAIALFYLSRTNHEQAVVA